MYLGKMAEIGTDDEIYDRPTHPYTQALLSAVPVPDPDGARAPRADHPRGRRPSPGQPAVGLPLPHPLLEGRRTSAPSEEPLLQIAARHARTPTPATSPRCAPGAVVDPQAAQASTKRSGSRDGSRFGPRRTRGPGSRRPGSRSFCGTANSSRPRPSTSQIESRSTTRSTTAQSPLNLSPEGVHLEPLGLKPTAAGPRQSGAWRGPHDPSRASQNWPLPEQGRLGDSNGRRRR